MVQTPQQRIIQLYELTLADGHVNVLHYGTWTTLQEYDVVPGDLAALRPRRVFSDLILVQSKDVLLDESALTGESTPILAKTAVDPVDRSRVWVGCAHSYQALLGGG
jgi:magnesium-transporting ATPase (P-type)